MMIRYSKILCVMAIAFYCFLAAFGNITDYFSNFRAVERALLMKELVPGSLIGYRAITSSLLHHLAFLTIVFFETATAFLCILGAWKLFKARHASASVFNHSKHWAIAGLTLGFLTWQVLFMSIGGEWFGLWMSPALSGAITTAFQIFITMLVVLVYLVSNDE